MREEHFNLEKGPFLTRQESLLLLSVALLGLAIVLIVAIYLLVSSSQGVPVEEVLSVTGEPMQVMLDQAEPIVLETSDYTWVMTPRAEFSIAARVIGSQHYWDIQKSLAPLDLALGWGDISNPEVDEWIQWSQSGRYVHRRVQDGSPYPLDYVNLHSANIHIIPSTDSLDSAIKRLDENDMVLLEGLLVDVTEASVGYVLTSLTRTDRGAGACEILYVQRLVVDGREYR